MSDILEIKSLIEAQGKAWEDHKKTNDALIAAKADGKAIGDLEAKLAVISTDLDKYTDLKSQFEEVMTKLQRPGAGAEDKTVTEEVKGFNDMLRADYQSKGRAAPAPLDTAGYAEYKTAFFKVASGVTVDSLSSAERKALSAGSDPDGGYLLPQSTVGRMVAKLYEQSTLRQLANVITISTEKIEGLIDNGEAGAGWVSEMGTRSDSTTPQLGKWEIAVHEMYAMPKITQKLIDDSATNVEAWLAAKVADKFFPALKVMRSPTATVLASLAACSATPLRLRLTTPAPGARLNTSRLAQTGHSTPPKLTRCKT